MCAYSTGSRGDASGRLAWGDDPDILPDLSQGHSVLGRELRDVKPSAVKPPDVNQGHPEQDRSGANRPGLDDPASIQAGWPEETGDGCVTLDAAAVLKANRRSFALRVRGQSMIGAGIYDGDVVVGEFTPEARPGAVVVALIDGESTLKRFVLQQGKSYLASENPNYPDLVPLSELVIQGVVHTVVRRVNSKL
jgi:hypothetical protein